MTRVNSENHIHIGLILGNKILEIQPKNNLLLSYESNYMTLTYGSVTELNSDMTVH